MRGSGISQKKFCPCFNNIQNVHGHSPLKSPASFRWAEMKQRKEVCGWQVLEQPVLPGENCNCNPDTKDCSHLSGLASLTPCWRKGGVKHARRGKQDLVPGLNADRGLSGRNHTGRRGWDRAAAAGEGQAFPQIPIIILPGLAGHIPRFPILSHQGIQALRKFSGPGQIFPRAQTPGRTRPSTTVSRITFKIRRGGNKKKKRINTYGAAICCGSSFWMQCWETFHHGYPKWSSTQLWSSLQKGTVLHAQGNRRDDIIGLF